MFDIDLQSRTPIYEQLYKRVTELIMRKSLLPGDKLPSVRELAKDLGVNPNTVSKAFQNLERDGIIKSLPGRGSFISDADSGALKRAAADNFGKAVRDALQAGLAEKELTEIISMITQTRGKQN